MASWLDTAIGAVVPGYTAMQRAQTAANVGKATNALQTNTVKNGIPTWVQPSYASTGPSNAPSGGINFSDAFKIANAVGQNGGTGTGTGSVSQSIPTNSDMGYSNIQQGADNGNSQIEADYNNSMNMLSGAESGLRGQADTANQTIDQQAGATQNEIANTQTTAEGATNASLSTAEKQGTSAMQQARDLYRQTNQQNSAQLSALGISSSSVAEALAERLGVETARRIAGVTGSVQEARQNAVNELGRIKTYYQGKISDLQNQVAVQKSTIQNSLLQGLNQINSARSQAASDKASARANLLNQVQTQIYNLTTQQQQFQQSLDQWAAQKSAALTPIVQDPNYLNTIISTAQNLNQQFAPTGFQFTPQVSYDKYGNMSGQISGQKPLTDQFGNPISSTATQQPTGQVTGGVPQPDFSKYPNDGFTY